MLGIGGGCVLWLTLTGGGCAIGQKTYLPKEKILAATISLTEKKKENRTSRAWLLVQMTGGLKGLASFRSGMDWWGAQVCSSAVSLMVNTGEGG